MRALPRPRTQPGGGAKPLRWSEKTWSTRMRGIGRAGVVVVVVLGLAIRAA